MDAARAQQGRRDHQACATTALQANIKDPREQPSAWIAPGGRCLVVLVLPRAPIAPLEGISPARDRPHAPSALLDSVMRAQPRASNTHSDQAVAGARRTARAGKHFCTVACTSRLLIVAARLFRH
jgi:hypothetical protein